MTARGRLGAGHDRAARARATVAPAMVLARTPRLALGHLRLRRVSRRSFDGWATPHSPRWWEYPWIEDAVRRHGGGGRAADFGAGRSPMPLALRDLGYRTTVVDPDTLRGEYDNEWHFTDYSPWGIETIRAGMQDRVFDESSLDVAVSVSVIEHVPADVRRQGLHQLGRALRPGGLLVLTVDLLPDGVRLWNHVVDEVEPLELHGTVDDLIAEAGTEGLALTERVRCPIVLPHLRVEALVFRAGAAGRADPASTAPS